jgi:hypothetical protein
MFSTRKFAVKTGNFTPIFKKHICTENDDKASYNNNNNNNNNKSILIFA